MSKCSADAFLSTGPLVGLSIAGVFLFELLVGVLVWLAIVLRRARKAKKSKTLSRSSTAVERQTLEEGETTAHTHRSSFVEQWLGKEAVTTYTPVEIEEYPVERQPYASYAPRGGRAILPTLCSHDPPAQKPSQPLSPRSIPHRPSQDPHGDVSYYSTAVAASLILPPQLPAPYDPPLSPRDHRPELPKLDIPRPLPPTSPRFRNKSPQPSVTSQTSYLRRISRGLLSTFSPAPESTSLDIEVPEVSSPPPFLKSLNPPFEPKSDRVQKSSSRGRATSTSRSLRRDRTELQREEAKV